MSGGDEHAARPAGARFGLLVAGGVVLVLASCLLGLALGPHPLSWRDALAGDPTAATILWDLRLPRVLLGALTGGALALVGAALQGLLRNPLADPYVMGVSGGAALGGSLALALGAGGVLGGLTLPLWAFLGAALSTAVVYLAAYRPGVVPVTHLLLSGVVFNAFAASIIMFLKTLVEARKAQELLYWLMGTLGDPHTQLLLPVAIYTAAGALVLLALSHRLNLMTLGDDEAHALGVPLERTKLAVFLASSLVVGAVVSLTGLVGFVGLIVPHLLRAAVGADHRRLLPLSFLGGAAFLVLADTGARMSFAVLGTEPPVGALTALVGGPFFIWVLRRSSAEAFTT